MRGKYIEKSIYRSIVRGNESNLPCVPNVMMDDEKSACAFAKFPFPIFSI